MDSVSDTAALAASTSAESDPVPPVPAAGSGPLRSQLAPQLAMGILVVVLCAFTLIAFLRLLFVSNSVWWLGPSVACMLALLCLQVFYLSRPTVRPKPPLSYLALLVQAGLVYVPMLHFKQAWIGEPGFLAGSVLLVLPPVLAGSAFVLVVASAGIAQATFTGVAFDVTFSIVSTVITGLVVYALTRLAVLVLELHQARSELAQMAVAQERLRFARDLHDLLGYSLSAITLKSELTHRLVNTHPARAQDELSEVLDISRRALSDVRAVASGYRELSLEAEAQSARSVLLAADVDVQMLLEYDQDLSAQVRTVLATILREGITNVLRHSKAERCEITIRQDGKQVQMDIVNDGVPQAPPKRAPHSGSGIHNLSVRVAALNGRLTAGLDADGRYRLQVAVPLAGPTAGSRQPAAGR
jgi:two-component system, NarL family, sensor histidine kinase DesK